MGGSDHAAEVAKRYSRDAGPYREHWAHVLAEPGRQLVAGLDIGGARTVLDLGCGVGTLLPELERSAPLASVVGADRAEGMIRLAPESFPRVVTDAAGPCFRESVFDAVVMAFMLFHLSRPHDALTAVRKLLKPGGQVALATWHADEDGYLPEQIWTEELDRHGAPPCDLVSASGELMNSPQKVTDLVTEAGFIQPETSLVPVVDDVGTDGYVARKTELGAGAVRFRSLPADVRAACLDRVRARLGALDPDEIVSKDVAILTWARKPGDE